MGESYMYQRLPYTRGEEEGEEEDEEERDGRIRESVRGQMVKSEVVVGHAVIRLLSLQSQHVCVCWIISGCVFVCTVGLQLQTLFHLSLILINRVVQSYPHGLACDL